MKENKKSGITPADNGTEEKTKGFPVVTEEDQANAAAFEMKKKTADGSWVAAAPVAVSGDSAELAEPKTREPLEDTEQAEENGQGTAVQSFFQIYHGASCPFIG